ncbi:MAG: FkbM family methyltransferase [Longimicrobiales bacterium]
MRRILLRILAALMRRLRRSLAGMRAGGYENDPDLIAAWRPLMDLLREKNGYYHETVRRLFIAEDVDGAPCSLWDVSDASTVRWLWQRALRRRVAAGPARHPLVLDLGANDGCVGSMSLNFIQLGWSAVLVEPLEEMMALARRNVAEHRREGQDVLFCSFALGDRDGEGLFEAEVAQDIAHMEGHLTTTPSSTTRSVRVVSVGSFVAMEEVRALLDASDLVVLSLDIEGGEIPVLGGFLEMGIHPDFVVIEHLRTAGEHDALLAAHGYRKLGRVAFNDLYERERSAA